MNAEKKIAKLFKEYKMDSLRMAKMAELMENYYWIGAGLGALAMFFLCVTVYGLVLR